MISINRWAAPATGVLAVLSLFGLLRPLPDYIAFFVGALAIALFPGIAVTRLLAGGMLRNDTYPERLAAWFVTGIGLLAAFGLAGMLLKMELSRLILVVALSYAALAAVLILRQFTLPGSPAGGDPGEGAKIAPLISWTVISIAIGLALLTLLTPRDYDDWYYLAYIKDFVSGTPLASEDAIFDMGQPATPRIWFGGGWWVLEAMLSKASGVDPVRCHQVFMPLLVLPMAVFAVYALARRVFRPAGAALLASGLQMLFYLSSAYPYKSAGWMVFARTAQDKAVAAFVVVPVAAAFALRLIRRGDRLSAGPPGGLIRLYFFAAFTSVLVHGMGPVWLGLIIVPIALVEWLRTRTRGATITAVQVLLPFFICAAALVAARDAVRDFLIAPVPELIRAPVVLSDLYLPGFTFDLGTDTTNPITWFVTEGFKTLNPLFITRYPLAIAGLVLVIGLVRYYRSAFAARFLLAVIVPTLLILFTPPGIRLAARFLTPKLVFRLSWIFPWGFVIAFFVWRLGTRSFAAGLVLLAVVLGLARGNPANYVKSFLPMRDRNRPSAEAVAAFDYLASQPSPQGVILASEATGRMIAAFLPKGYPVNFREFGPVGSEELADMVGVEHIDAAWEAQIERNRVHYILIENRKPLARALLEAKAGFQLEYSNSSYSLWRKR